VKGACKDDRECERGPLSYPTCEPGGPHRDGKFASERVAYEGGGQGRLLKV